MKAAAGALMSWDTRCSWGDPDGNGAHGLNERRGVRSVYVGRDFLTELIKACADAT